jgi:hypothetical protein
MRIASNISKRTTVNLPDSTALAEGQCIQSLATGAILANSGTGASIKGVAMVDVPARQAYNSTTSLAIPMNVPRATPFATEGLVPIKVQDVANYNALTVDGNFGVLNGNAVAVGVGGATAVNAHGTTNAANSALLIREKKAVAGLYFILVEIN